MRGRVSALNQRGELSVPAWWFGALIHVCSAPAPGENVPHARTRHTCSHTHSRMSDSKRVVPQRLLEKKEWKKVYRTTAECNILSQADDCWILRNTCKLQLTKSETEHSALSFLVKNVLTLVFKLLTSPDLFLLKRLKIIL